MVFGTWNRLSGKICEKIYIHVLAVLIAIIPLVINRNVHTMYISIWCGFKLQYIWAVQKFNQSSPIKLKLWLYIQIWFIIINDAYSVYHNFDYMRYIYFNRHIMHICYNINYEYAIKSIRKFIALWNTDTGVRHFSPHYSYM